ncbi:hypothetical protein SEA_DANIELLEIGNACE_86 [Arthrobacter phage DanielleIgnace]|nr:hypothetical protein SEA_DANIELLEIGNACE_86 [Arthrobacter phage DanielleIgnace]
MVAKDPFNASVEVVTEEQEAAQAEVEGYDEDGVEFTQDPVKLGDAAQAAFGENLEGLSGTQEELDGTDFLKVKFVGMSMDSLDREIGLGDEYTFLVKARCTGNGTDLAKTDGHQRRFVKMDVNSVIIKE